MSVIPIVAEALDLMPKELKTVIFLAVLVGSVGVLSWLTGVRAVIDGTIGFIGSVFGIKYLTLTSAIVIIFLMLTVFSIIRLDSWIKT